MMKTPSTPNNHIIPTLTKHFSSLPDPEFISKNEGHSGRLTQLSSALHNVIILFIDLSLDCKIKRYQNKQNRFQQYK